MSISPPPPMLAPGSTSSEDSLLASPPEPSPGAQLMADAAAPGTTSKPSPTLLAHPFFSAPPASTNAPAIVLPDRTDVSPASTIRGPRPVSMPMGRSRSAGGASTFALAQGSGSGGIGHHPRPNAPMRSPTVDNFVQTRMARSGSASAASGRHVRRGSIDGMPPGLGHPSSGPMSREVSFDQRIQRDPTVGVRVESIEAKVVVLGSQGVGKTSIVHRYISGTFTSPLTTIGASFLTKKMVLQDCKVRLQIWDTAGQERFRSMAPIYYRGSHAAILVYDITNRNSLADIKIWLDELKQNMTSELIIHVVGSKLDLADTGRAVTLEEAQATIRSWVNPEPVTPVRPIPTRGTSTARALAKFSSGASSRQSGDDARADPPVITWRDVEVSEVSAKSDTGIDDLFFRVTRQLVRRSQQIESDSKLRARDSVMLQEPAAPPPASSALFGCC